MQTRDFILSALIGCTLAVALNGPALALPPGLTLDEKKGIYSRCTDAGGTVKTCCAAAEGTVVLDTSTGFTYCRMALKAPSGGLLRRLLNPGVQTLSK